jgi:hypothetical protein
MADHKKGARWIVTISYRGDLGVIDNEFHVEELMDVSRLVEWGPDWNSLIKIEIVLNPKRRSNDNDTVEKSPGPARVA